MDELFPYYWTLYFHHPTDNNWDIDSYKKICEIRTPRDFWNIWNYMKNDIIENSMLFIMKEDIPPLWENEKNINGGSWSFKIYKKNINRVLTDVVIHCLTGEIITMSDCIEIDDSSSIDSSSKSSIDSSSKSSITGLTLSPKRAFSIIKIWNDDSSKNNVKQLINTIPDFILKDSLYKPHKQR
jgi:hypothetical protein